LSAEAVGLARAMQQVANTLNLPINSLQHIAPTIAANALVHKGTTGMDKALLRISAAGALFVFLTTMLLLVTSDLVIPIILGSKLPGSFVLLIAFLFLNAVMLVRFPLVIRAQSLEQPVKVAIGACVGSLTSIAMVLFAHQYLAVLAIPLSLIVGVMANSVALWLVQTDDK
ncbi:MAG: hypothetical protein AAF683_15665, partial [Pseudomonadota bacterium]